MALRTENLISTLIFELDRASTRRAIDAKSKLEGDVNVGVNVDEKGFNKSVGGFKKSFNGLSVIGVAAGGVLADAFIGATQAIGGTIQESIRLAAEAEQTNVAFSTFLGSTERAKEVIADLEQFSLDTPFEPNQVIEAGKALIAFGEPVDTLTTSLGQIGDLSAGTGKDFNELAIIFGKARVAGTLFGEDINQLTEAGIPVIQEFAKQLGVSESAVKKLASEGKIGFDNLQQAFSDLTGEGGKFFELTARQSRTVAGLQSTLSGAFSSLQKSLGEAVLPLAREVLPRLISGLFSLVKAARNAAEPIASFFIGTFRAIGQVLNPLIESVRSFFSRFEAGGGVLQSLQPVFTFLARTFTLISTNIGRVVTAFGGLIDFFRGQLGGNSVVGKFVGFISDAFSNLPALINGVVEVFFALPTAISDGLSSAILEVRAFVSDLATILNPINLGRAIVDGFDSLDFSAGNALRDQADQFKGFGTTVADAFREGFDEINNVEFELPDIVGPEGIERATQAGEGVGDAIAAGAGKAIKEKLPEGSLAALKKALSEVETKLDSIANVSAFDGKGIDNLRLKIQEIADKKEEIELLESVLDRLSGPDLGVTDSLVSGEAFSGAVSAIDALRERLPALRQRIEITTDPETLKKLQSEYEEILNTLNKYDPELKEIRGLVKSISEETEEGFFNLSPDEIEGAKETANKILEVAKDLTSNLLAESIARKDDEIRIQQERLDATLNIADQGNAEQVQLEEERLRKLTEEREKYVRTQRQLAAAQIAIENAVAIAGAIRLIATSTNPVDIALRSVLVAATIASTISTLSGAFGDAPSFYQGTESTPGATTKGMMIGVHGKERILNAADNAPLLKMNVRNNEIPSLVEMGLMMRSARIPSSLMAPRPDETIADLKKQNGAIMKELKLTRKAIGNLRVSQSIDKNGVRQMVDSEERRVSRRAKLRR